MCIHTASPGAKLPACQPPRGSDAERRQRYCGSPLTPPFGMGGGGIAMDAGSQSTCSLVHRLTRSRFRHTHQSMCFPQADIGAPIDEQNSAERRAPCGGLSSKNLHALLSAGRKSAMGLVNVPRSEATSLLSLGCTRSTLASSSANACVRISLRGCSWPTAGMPTSAQRFPTQVRLSGFIWGLSGSQVLHLRAARREPARFNPKLHTASCIPRLLALLYLPRRKPAPVLQVLEGSAPL